MRINQKGVDLIKSFEGCRLTAYLCPSNVWTIGYGHTSGVKKGMTITQEEADLFLMRDLDKYEKYVAATKLDLNENQFSALVSFTFNCGNGNLKKLIKNRTLPQIADALLLYNKSNGVSLNGLVRRRKAERDLFLTEVEEITTEDIKMPKNVNYYSYAKEKNVSLSKNFKAKEMRCKDGSDVIFVAPALVDILQKIRDHFGKPVTINSGYRTVSYNKKIGGATYSQHCYGTAADIKVSGVKPKDVAAYVETLMLNWGGIGIYKNFTHVDVRDTKSRWNG